MGWSSFASTLEKFSHHVRTSSPDQSPVPYSAIRQISRLFGMKLALERHQAVTPDKRHALEFQFWREALEYLKIPLAYSWSSDKPQEGRESLEFDVAIEVLFENPRRTIVAFMTAPRTLEIDGRDRLVVIGFDHTHDHSVPGHNCPLLIMMVDATHIDLTT